jgi:hypothetical protein
MLADRRKGEGMAATDWVEYNMGFLLAIIPYCSRFL